jgi:hypothetical protein
VRREGEGETERKRRKKLREEKKRRGEKRKKKREKINYLFVENMINKLYCLLLFGKENKK